MAKGESRSERNARVLAESQQRISDRKFRVGLAAHEAAGGSSASTPRGKAASKAPEGAHPGNLHDLNTSSGRAAFNQGREKQSVAPLPQRTTDAIAARHERNRAADARMLGRERLAKQDARAQSKAPDGTHPGNNHDVSGEKRNRQGEWSK